jgi:hypothetical protein
MSITDITSLEQLSVQISGFTSILSKHLSGRDQDSEDWSKAPEEIQNVRAKLLETTRVLGERVQGPGDRLREMATEVRSSLDDFAGGLVCTNQEATTVDVTLVAALASPLRYREARS